MWHTQRAEFTAVYQTQNFGDKMVLENQFSESSVDSKASNKILTIGF